jgi:hypothetical protein
MLCAFPFLIHTSLIRKYIFSQMSLSCWYEPNSDFHEHTISHTECQQFLNIAEPAP